jgi:hypothetical protein
VLFALVYLLLRHVFRLIASSSNDQLSTEVEPVILRHQLKVKGTQTPDRPRNQCVSYHRPPPRGRFGSCSSRSRTCCCAVCSNSSLEGLDWTLGLAPLGTGGPRLRLALPRGQAPSGSRAEDAEPQARSACWLSQWRAGSTASCAWWPDP